MEQRFEYDFNVIYNRTYNRRTPIALFVDYIVKYLEENKMKGFYPERDLLPGKNLFDENIRVIEASKRTILAIDNDFLKSNWNVYLKKLTLKSCIDSPEGETRVVPVCFNVDPDAMKEKFKSLQCHEFIYFEANYVYDTISKTKLMNVVSSGFSQLKDASIGATPFPYQESEEEKQSKNLAPGTSNEMEFLDVTSLSQQDADVIEYQLSALQTGLDQPDGCRESGDTTEFLGENVVYKLGDEDFQFSAHEGNGEDFPDGNLGTQDRSDTLKGDDEAPILTTKQTSPDGPRTDISVNGAGQSHSIPYNTNMATKSAAKRLTSPEKQQPFTQQETFVSQRPRAIVNPLKSSPANNENSDTESCQNCGSETGTNQNTASSDMPNHAAVSSHTNGTLAISPAEHINTVNSHGAESRNSNSLHNTALSQAMKRTDTHTETRQNVSSNPDEVLYQMDAVSGDNLPDLIAGRQILSASGNEYNVHSRAHDTPFMDKTTSVNHGTVQTIQPVSMNYPERGLRHSQEHASQGESGTSTVPCLPTYTVEEAYLTQDVGSANAIPQRSVITGGEVENPQPEPSGVFGRILSIFESING